MKLSERSLSDTYLSAVHVLLAAAIARRRIDLRPVDEFESFDAWSLANHAAEEALNKATDALIALVDDAAPRVNAAVPISNPGPSKYDAEPEQEPE